MAEENLGFGLREHEVRSFVERIAVENLIERLRAHDRQASASPASIALCNEAADEIERLLRVCKDKTILLKDAYAQVERFAVRCGDA